MTRLERLTPEEAAEEVGCSREHLYRLMKRREIGYIQLAGRGRALLRAHIDAYLARREAPAKGEERVFSPIYPPSAKSQRGDGGYLQAVGSTNGRLS